MENNTEIRERLTSISKNEGKSFMNIMNKFIRTVDDLDKFVLLPSRLRDVPLQGTLAIGNDPNADGSNPTEIDLIDVYSLLLKMKSDLTSQGQTELDISTQTDLDPILALFRYHVNALNTMFHQLTNTAGVLKKEYKNSVGDNSE